MIMPTINPAALLLLLSPPLQNTPHSNQGGIKGALGGKAAENIKKRVEDVAAQVGGAYGCGLEVRGALLGFRGQESKTRVLPSGA